MLPPLLLLLLVLSVVLDDDDVDVDVDVYVDDLQGGRGGGMCGTPPACAGPAV